MIKRLFVFANYDKDSIIDESTILYVCELSKFGDVIFYMDNDTNDSEIAKIKPYTIYAGSNRHCEYDFGSYKRGFIWALDNNILSKYDFVYLVNSSMYGPFGSLNSIIEELESKNKNAFSIAYNDHKKEPHLESWFVGMDKNVFLSDGFISFIKNVKKLSDKGLVAWAYEHGFTRMLIANNFSFCGKYNVYGRQTYNNIKRLYLQGMPFIKKLSFTRKHGALGRQVLWVLNRLDPNVKASIIKNEIRLHGEKYTKQFLTKNPVKILYRNIRHALYKLFIEGI